MLRRKSSLLSAIYLVSGCLLEGDSLVNLHTSVRTIRYPDGYIPAKFTEDALQSAHNILIIGDAGGRDAGYLSNLGKAITQLDIADQGRADIYIQSIEDRTPFADGSFDGVVLNEVLEHLYRDVDALKEIHRIMKSDGTLVATVPASRRQDRAPFHVRIHTENTLRRLLATGGFEVEELWYRGVGCRLPQWTLGRIACYSIFTVSAAFVSEERAVDFYNEPMFRFERWLGRRRVGRLIQMMCISYGFMVIARPSVPTNPDEVQIRRFRSFGKND